MYYCLITFKRRFECCAFKETFTKDKKPILEWNENADFIFTYHRPPDNIFVYTCGWSGISGRKQTVLKCEILWSSDVILNPI